MAKANFGGIWGSSNPVEAWQKQLAAANRHMTLAEQLTASIQKAVPKTSKYAWDFLANPRSNLGLLPDSLVKSIEKSLQVDKVLFGRRELTSIARYMQDIPKQTRIGTQTNDLVKSIQKMVREDAGAFNTYISLAGKISKVIKANSALEAATLSAERFVTPAIKFNPLDILAGFNFANLVKLSELESSRESLEEQLTLAGNQILNDPEVQQVAQEFAQEVREERTYESLEEKLINFIDTIVKKFGARKQIAYYIAFLVFLALDTGKDLVVNAATDNSSPTINVYQTNIINPLPRKLDLIIRAAPIYLKTSTSTRKVGVFPVNIQVEILRKKEGWCLVKGIAKITRKIEGTSTKKDTLISGWIKQRYLHSFQ